jgi:formylglycine-generating enzyme required for sulfatase activity
MMSAIGASPGRKPPTIFISAVSSEFRRQREVIAERLKAYAVHVQKDHPTTLYSHNEIAKAIEQSDLIICLVGYKSGGSFKPDGRPADAAEGSSYTQWEYDHAREVVRRHSEKRLVVFRKMGTPDGPVDAGQAAFRERIYTAEMGKGGLFFYPCDDAHALADSLERTIRDPVGGLAAILYAYWLKVRDEYRAQVVAAWHKDVRHTYTTRTDARARRRLMRAAVPPFIATRAFSILNPNKRRQLRFLKPVAFLTGRDTNAELLARKDADWRPIAPKDDLRAGGDQIVDALLQPRGTRVTLGPVELTRPIRLFIVSGSGIGKTVTLRWLQARLNGLPGTSDDRAPVCSRLAILLLAGDLRTVAAADLIELLVEHLIHKVGLRAEPWQPDVLRVGLTKDADDGNLVLLIDGLDHSPTDLKLLIESQRRSDGWGTCPIVAAGRPQVMLNWQEGQPHGTGIDAANWRFVEPSEFSEKEATVFLGNIGPDSRMSVVEENLAGLLRVPRILDIVRKLTDDELKTSRTAADIYYFAVKHLVKAAMNGPATREFGPNWQAYAGLAEPHEEQIEHMLVLLSALGFISLCVTIDAADPKESHDFRMPLMKPRKDRLRARIKAATGVELTSRELERDLRAVAEMSSVVSNGILEDLSEGTRNLTTIMWANRTVQQFFAALWLARYADGAEAVRAVLLGESLLASRDPAYDAQRTRHYVFFSEADELAWVGAGCPNIIKTDTTYEFNLFLAEMPWSAIEPRSWVAAASAWYDPQLFTDQASTLRVWSTEMLYRSWQTMLRCAGRPLDDWWDAPYESLAQHRPGLVRNKISLHQDPPLNDPEPLARLVLDRFLSEFEHILHDSATPRAAIAHKMIAAKQWIKVPTKADYVMGQPRGSSQGCPTRKVDTYWKVQLLDAVQTRANDRTPEAAAELGTWKEWFAPTAVGKSGRAFDVAWLKEILQPLADEGAARALQLADRNSPVYQKALKLIQARFQTADETPAQNPQYVRGFEMHKLPVLHEWFGLFAPGHARVVGTYLGGLVPPAAHPPGDHPVTYIAWFDAWAFCQWTTWRDKATGTRFGFRLPHEPEWEYAARGVIDDGKPGQIPRDWRWWWKGGFYKDENSMEEEHLSTPQAHADGRPGKTRAPRKAAPNGLGFHDILGNVWEWTATLYSLRRERDTMHAHRFTLRYSRYDPVDRPPVNGQRTMRGGLWYYLNILATCTNRFRYACNDRDFKMGFRVVREPRPEQ